MSENIKIKRIYDEAADADGARILVDRLWPRGIKKVDAGLTEWLKTLAPSNDLRKWFGHDPEKFQEFAEKYRAELDSNEQAEDFAKSIPNLISKFGAVTLLYAAKDAEHNNAVILQAWLKERM